MEGKADMTNADKIRQMSDEELGDFLRRQVDSQWLNEDEILSFIYDVRIIINGGYNDLGIYLSGRECERLVRILDGVRANLRIIFKEEVKDETNNFKS